MCSCFRSYWSFCCRFRRGCPGVVLGKQKPRGLVPPGCRNPHAIHRNVRRYQVRRRNNSKGQNQRRARGMRRERRIVSAALAFHPAMCITPLTPKCSRTGISMRRNPDAYVDHRIPHRLTVFAKACGEQKKVGRHRACRQHHNDAPRLSDHAAALSGFILCFLS